MVFRSADVKEEMKFEVVRRCKICGAILKPEEAVICLDCEDEVVNG